MNAWTGKAERGSTSLIRLIVWLARTGGRRLCMVLIYPITFYFLLADGTARRASAQFLQAALGRRPRWTDSFQHLRSFAITLLDRVYMSAGEFHRFDVRIEGLLLVEHALQGGKGCLLLGSHLGSFDLMMLAQRAMDGRPISVLMRVDPRARLRSIAGIAQAGPQLIPTGQPGSLLRAHEALSRGEIVGLLADRVDDGAASLPAVFLGHTVTMPLAPHVLAARSGAAVLACFGLHEGANRYTIVFENLGPAPAPDARGAALQPALDRYTALLEQYARQHPLNWFNFYPYWVDEKDKA
jgi:predicted LPLAT superfamily acyltransferase